MMSWMSTSQQVCETEPPPNGLMRQSLDKSECRDKRWGMLAVSASGDVVLNMKFQTQQDKKGLTCETHDKAFLSLFPSFFFFLDRWNINKEIV